MPEHLIDSDNMKRKIYILLCVLAVVAGCDENSGALFRSTAPSADERFALSMQYNDREGYTTIQARDDEYSVYVCTDTHVATVNTKLQAFIQLYRDDRTCPVAVCLGDLIEADHSYIWFVDAFKHIKTNPSKPDTMFVTIGNHDVFYDQWHNYTQYWPTSTYYFVVETNGKNKGKDLFICLDTAQGTLGRKQLTWLKELLDWADGERFRHIIVYSHINIFRRDNMFADISTVSLEETYELMSLFTEHNVEQFWAGHDHGREEFTHGNVKYIIVDSMKEEEDSSAYMVLHVGKEINNTFHTITVDSI